MGQAQVKITINDENSPPKRNLLSCVGKVAPTNECEYLDITKAQENDNLSNKGGSGVSLNSTIPAYLNSVSRDYMEPWDNLENSLQNSIEVKSHRTSKISAIIDPNDTFLSQCVWYVGTQTRIQAESNLMAAPLYSFVVRLSEAPDNNRYLIVK